MLAVEVIGDLLIEAERLNRTSVPLARKIGAAIEWCKYRKQPEWDMRIAAARAAGRGK